MQGLHLNCRRESQISLSEHHFSKLQLMCHLQQLRLCQMHPNVLFIPQGNGLILCLSLWDLGSEEYINSYHRLTNDMNIQYSSQFQPCLQLAPTLLFQPISS